MAMVHDDVLDASLNEIGDNADELHICSQEPADYTEATSTYDLGEKSDPSFTGPQDEGGGDGRTIEVDAISDGSVTDDGTATYWALVDTVTSRLLATEELDSSQAVTTGNAFTLEAIEIQAPDVV